MKNASLKEMPYLPSSALLSKSILAATLERHLGQRSLGMEAGGSSLPCARKLGSKSEPVRSRSSYYCFERAANTAATIRRVVMASQ